MLNITSVSIHLVEGDSKLRAYASMTIDDCFVVRNLKIIDGSKGFFVAMPNRKLSDGTFKDIAHPINDETRQQIENRILDAYEETINAKDQKNGMTIDK